MIFTDEKNYIFVRSLKCASFSMIMGLQHSIGGRHRRLLQSNALTDCSPEQLERYASGVDRFPAAYLWKEHLSKYHPGMWDALFTFTLVRNPYDRAVSMWRYGQTNAKLQSTVAFSLAQLTWPEFIDRILIAREGDNVHYHPTSECHCHPETGEFLLDKFYRLEQFDEAREDLGERFKVTVPRKHLNASEHAPWRSLYTEELAEKVYSVFEQDFVNWSYNKDSWKGE